MHPATTHIINLNLSSAVHKIGSPLAEPELVFLQFCSWRICPLSFWGKQSILSLKPSIPKICALFPPVVPQEGLSQQQWLMFYPAEPWPHLCSAFIDRSVMESPWILIVYGLLSSSTACCIIYGMWNVFILSILGEMAQSQFLNLCPSFREAILFLQLHTNRLIFSCVDSALMHQKWKRD